MRDQRQAQRDGDHHPAAGRHRVDPRTAQAPDPDCLQHPAEGEARLPQDEDEKHLGGDRVAVSERQGEQRLPDENRAGGERHDDGGSQQNEIEDVWPDGRLRHPGHTGTEREVDGRQGQAQPQDQGPGCRIVPDRGMR